MRVGHPLPDRESRTNGGAGTNGTGRSVVERIVRRRGSPSIPAEQPRGEARESKVIVT